MEETRMPRVGYLIELRAGADGNFNRTLMVRCQQVFPKYPSGTSCVTTETFLYAFGSPP
jgi:hypothetical protein